MDHPTKHCLDASKCHCSKKLQKEFGHLSKMKTKETHWLHESVTTISEFGRYTSTPDQLYIEESPEKWKRCWLSRAVIPCQLSHAFCRDGYPKQILCRQGVYLCSPKQVALVVSWTGMILIMLPYFLGVRHFTKELSTFPIGCFGIEDWLIANSM